MGGVDGEHFEGAQGGGAPRERRASPRMATERARSSVRRNAARHRRSRRRSGPTTLTPCPPLTLPVSPTHRRMPHRAWLGDRLPHPDVRRAGQHPRPPVEIAISSLLSRPCMSPRLASSCPTHRPWQPARSPTSDHPCSRHHGSCARIHNSASIVSPYDRPTRDDRRAKWPPGTEATIAAGRHYAHVVGRIGALNDSTWPLRQLTTGCA